MKIEQQKSIFNPITITLETKEEAEAFMMIIKNRIESASLNGVEDKNIYDLCKSVSNWFFNEGHF